MTNIRKMTCHDVPSGMRLKNQAGWNQTETDWRRFLELEPEGCFVAELDGQAVGTATTCVLDAVGWIGMLLVDESVRGRGIGTRLMSHCLEYLDARHVPTVRLDATPAGRPIYERLGFVTDYELVRMEGIAPDEVDPTGTRPIRPKQLDAVFDLDRQVRGLDRHRLIKSLYELRPEAMRVFVEGERILGYGLLRDGMFATQIGPAVALTEKAGQALGDAALEQCPGRTVFIDIPTDNTAATGWAESRGLQVRRPLTRMHRGRPVHDQPTRQWAGSGPEKG